MNILLGALTIGGGSARPGGGGGSSQRSQISLGSCPAYTKTVQKPAGFLHLLTFKSRKHRFLLKSN